MSEMSLTQIILRISAHWNNQRNSGRFLQFLKKVVFQTSRCNVVIFWNYLPLTTQRILILIDDLSFRCNQIIIQKIHASLTESRGQEDEQLGSNIIFCF
jgi:sensor histidine kinase YesM